MAIVVGSQRQGSLSPALGAVVVKIDRASVLGNPFDMGNNEALRQLVTEAHQSWLDVVLQRGSRIDAVKLAIGMAAELELTIAQSWKRPSSRAVIEELFRIEQLAQTHEVWIMCWCGPKACHGDAYKDAIESRRVAAAYQQLQTQLRSTLSPQKSLALPDWRSAITPEAMAAQQFEYQGRWIKNWFSNMEPFDEPLVVRGVAYATPENLYQAMKTFDPNERARIAAMSPTQAKQAGKRIVLRPDWEQVKVEYMEAALRHKFKPGTSCHQTLMKTGNEPIVEVNNWHDNFWGVCICQTCQLKPKQNRLGVLLMVLRAEYAQVSDPQGGGAIPGIGECRSW